MSDEEFCFREQQRETSITARGVHGMTHGSRPKRPRLAVTAPIADMVIKKNGRATIVPAFFFTQAGTIRKSYQTQFQELLAGTAYDEPCQICEDCNCGPNDCALLP
jgi:hypothetical protein